MTPFFKLKWIIALLFLSVNAQTLLAQTKADIFDTRLPITWLGVDYSQTKFVGRPERGGSFADSTLLNQEFRLVFTAEWNFLFINEMKKYDVAKAVHRASVKYNIEVALNANEALTKKNFFTTNPGDFKLLDEAAIVDIVKNYNFGNADGIGLIFFAEGMNKATDLMGLWVTFVDIKSKTVLLTKYTTGKTGGMGFRNNWASPLFQTLKSMETDFDKWK